MGQTRQLIALIVQPDNGDAIAPTGTLPFTANGTFNQPPTSQSNVTVHWVSSNSSVATVDPTGVATCVAISTVHISASAPGNGGMVNASATLNCLSAPPPHIGSCLVGRDNTLTGSCVGARGEICHAAYDPTNCPVGQPPTGVTSDQCGSSGLLTSTLQDPALRSLNL
jgi:Bacterial Ig-like domain (group 2)